MIDAEEILVYILWIIVMCAFQQNVEFVNVSTGGTYKYHWTFKGTLYQLNNYAVLGDKLHHKLGKVYFWKTWLSLVL